MTLRAAIEQGTKILDEAAVPAPRLTAEVLLAHALQRDRVWLFAHSDEDLSELGWIHFGRYLYQRTDGVPTQYITKTQEFYGRAFRVTPDVLIPRPETEHVVATALELLVGQASTPARDAHVPQKPDLEVRRRSGDLPHLVDVGTGSGAIAVTLALESNWRVHATDISETALSVARCNAKTLGASVQFLRADLLNPFADSSFDAIVSNPPYVGLSEADGLQREVKDHEPHVALFAGADGNTLYRRLVTEAERVLKPGGYLILELGYRSLDAVWAMLGEGWSAHRHEADLAGIPRVLAARWRA